MEKSEKKNYQLLINSLNLPYKQQQVQGKGSFGELYLAKNTKDTKQRVAIKIEKTKSSNYSTLNKEAKIMLIMKDVEGFPNVRQFRYNEKISLLVMDQLGPNLERMLKSTGGQLSLKTVQLIGIQMLDRLEEFHKKGLIHRDIKPENFVMGDGHDINMQYLIDFGIAKLYKNSDEEHISPKEGKGLIGTARYTSINSHQGIEQSRRDDLEGLAYTLIYLLKGRLPWQDVKGRTKKEKYDQIVQMKKDISEKLNKNNEYPEEFMFLVSHAQSLNFTETPNYSQLRQKLRDLFMKVSPNSTFNYDWILIENNIKKIPQEFSRFENLCNGEGYIRKSSFPELQESIFNSQKLKNVQFENKKTEVEKVNVDQKSLINSTVNKNQTEGRSNSITLGKKESQSRILPLSKSKITKVYLQSNTVRSVSSNELGSTKNQGKSNLKSESMNIRAYTHIFKSKRNSSKNNTDSHAEGMEAQDHIIGKNHLHKCTFIKASNSPFDEVLTNGNKCPAQLSEKSMASAKSKYNEKKDFEVEELKNSGFEKSVNIQLNEELEQIVEEKIQYESCSNSVKNENPKEKNSENIKNDKSAKNKLIKIRSQRTWQSQILTPTLEKQPKKTQKDNEITENKNLCKTNEFYANKEKFSKESYIHHINLKKEIYESLNNTKIPDNDLKNQLSQNDLKFTSNKKNINKQKIYELSEINHNIKKNQIKTSKNLIEAYKEVFDKNIYNEMPMIDTEESQHFLGIKLNSLRKKESKFLNQLKMNE